MMGIGKFYEFYILVCDTWSTSTQLQRNMNVDTICLPQEDNSV